MKWLLMVLIFIIAYFSFSCFDFTNISILAIIFSLFICLILQIIVHETGHLIFGLLTGYHFVSFRILFLVFMKENHKLKCLFLPDLAFLGQCLMAPPGKDNHGDFPYFWCNAGGVVQNLIASIIAGGMLFVTSGFLQFFLAIFSFCGLILAIMNAIPSVDKIPNDGHNLQSMRSNRYARDAYYIQLDVTAKVFQGGGYAGLDRSSITLSPSATLDAPLVLTAKFIEYYHYCHNLEFEPALMLITKLYYARSTLKYHRDLILLEQIFMTIMNDNFERAKTMYDRLPKNIPPALLASKDIDKKRISLAIQAFLGNNEEMVEYLYQQCQLSAADFHLPGVARDELKLVEFIKHKYDNLKQQNLSSELPITK